MNFFIQQRLNNQHLLATAFQHPAEVVQWFGAMQAQDFAGAKWGIGMRLDPAAAVISDRAIEAAYDAGAILRTHILRPTWHFVTPADIRWLLTVTAPRVHQLNMPYYRKMGVDDELYARARNAIVDALQGGVYLTRDELRDRLAGPELALEVELRMVYILMRAELDGLICSGPRRGKQFTYALLEERAAPGPPLSREEGLAELARRFFISHGPATAHDLARWASLTLEEARRGLAANAGSLQSAAIDGATYWFSPDANPSPVANQRPEGHHIAHLLSIYDEYVIGYKEWRVITDAGDEAELRALENNLTNVILLDGRIAGTWKRDLGKREVTVYLMPLRPLDAQQTATIAAAVARFGAFYNLPARMVW